MSSLLPSRKHIPTIGAAFVLGSCLAFAQTAAPPDPWKSVPRPTSCYPDDGLDEQIAKAKAAVDADLTRQKAANDELRKKLDAIDGMERAKRTQEFLMKDPQRGMAVMQEIGQLGTSVNTDLTAFTTHTKTLEQELPRISADFKAAVDKAIAPVRTEQAAWEKSKATVRGEAGNGFATAADYDRYVELLKKENAEYEKVCSSFFSPTGPFTRWLNGYKDALEKNVDAMAANDRGTVLNLQMMGIPGAFRPTGTFEAVGMYLDQLSRIYRNRLPKADPGTVGRPFKPVSNK